MLLNIIYQMVMRNAEDEDEQDKITEELLAPLGKIKESESVSLDLTLPGRTFLVV